MVSSSVAIVILNYNGRNLLEKYLPSVMDLNYPDFQVIVVDNNSSDGSVAFLRESYQDIHIVENDENVGISRGLNRGAETAPDVDYYWFMNNDVKVTEDSLTRLVDHIAATPQTGIVFPRINEMGSDRIQSLGFDYDMFAHGALPARDEGQLEPSNKSPHEIVVGMGAAMLVSQKVWDAIGGFDKHNFIYEGDTYLCLQAWIRGYHVEAVPDSIVYHEKEATLHDNPIVPFHGMRSKTRVYLKSLQLRTLIAGMPGFMLLFFGNIIMDVMVRRKPRVAFARLRGFLSALVSFREIYRSRNDIQDERVYPDSRFLTPVSETFSIPFFN